MHSSIIVTNLDCNLNCSYCYEHNKANKVINLDHLREFIKFMFDKCYSEDGESGKIKFHLIGGEPFMHPEIVKEVCKLSKELYKQYNFKKLPLIYISTNGTLIDRQDILDEVLYPYKDILDLGFSIDGNKLTHNKYRKTIDGKDTYDKAINNLKLAISILGDRRAGCKCTYNHDTIHDWFNGVKSLVDIGVRTISANYVTEEVWPKEEAPMLFDQFSKMIDYLFENDIYDVVNIKQCWFKSLDQSINFSPDKVNNISCRTCHAIKENFCISVDGLIYPCHRFAALQDTRFSIGYLSNGKFILTNSPLKKKISEFCSLKTLDKACAECNLKYLCYTCSEYYFEQNPDNPIEARNSQKEPLCAWTIAETAARLYFRRKLRATIGFDPDSTEDIVLTKHEVKET